MLKRQHSMMSAFSMSSMTDVIFLLLIFFMVTSTFVFPTGLEVNLPQSTEQSALKPSTRIYIDADKNIYGSAGDEQPQPLQIDALVPFLKMAHEQDSTGFIALYADENVPYGRIVEVLNAGASNNIKMVLATKPVANHAQDILPDAVPATDLSGDMTTPNQSTQQD